MDDTTPPTPTPPAGGGTPPPNTPPAILADGLNFAPEWYTALPEEFQGLAKDAKSIPDVLARLKSARDDIANRGSGLKIPGEKATDEEKSQFRATLYKHLGVPETPDDYDLSAPEGFDSDTELIKEIAAVMPKAGVTKEGAKLIADTYSKVIAQRVQAIQAQAQAEREADRQALATEYGTKIDAAVAQAKEAAKAAGWPEETMDPTHDAFIGAKPFQLIQSLLSRVAKAEGVDRTGGTSLANVRDAAWGKRVMAGLEPESAAYKDRAHPQHEEIHKAVLAAYAVTHKGKA